MRGLFVLLLEATIRLELMNKSFADSPLTNLGTSPKAKRNIGKIHFYFKGICSKNLCFLFFSGEIQEHHKKNGGGHSRAMAPESSHPDAFAP